MFHGFNNFQKMLAIVQKIHITFRDDIGNSKSGTGTGFWVKTNREKFIFVTNKHNIDPSLNEEYKRLSLRNLILDFRSSDSSDPALSIIKHDITYWKIYKNESPDSPDVAIIEFGGFLMPNLSLPWLPQSYLANEEYFINELEFGDPCHFTGFPGNARNQSKYDFPILRSCFISSWPRIDYFEEDRHLKTSEIFLVNGLSFGGSSGSPVFSYERGIKVGEGLTGGQYRESRLVGIMSGHWNEKNNTHSGLSYVTKSSAILDLIEKNNL
jgi:hypothetical protein